MPLYRVTFYSEEVNAPNQEAAAQIALETLSRRLAEVAEYPSLRVTLANDADWPPSPESRDWLACECGEGHSCNSLAGLRVEREQRARRELSAIKRGRR